MAGKDGEPWIALAESPIAGIELAKANVARAPADPADAKSAGASINAFGLDLFRAMLADPALDLRAKNAVFSPASIALALGMVRAGARGDTAAQMDGVLLRRATLGARQHCGVFRHRVGVGDRHIGDSTLPPRPNK